MTWMNEYEIGDAAERWYDHPVLGPATRTLVNLRNAVNQHSDGWAYWNKPARAADQLMQFVMGHGRWSRPRGNGEVTREQLAAVYAPIRRFQKDTGLDFFIDEGETQTVIVTTVCTATVEEWWTFRAPIDWTPDDIEEAFNDDEFGGLEYLSVRNAKVDDERDREIRSVEVSP